MIDAICRVGGLQVDCSREVKEGEIGDKIWYRRETLAFADKENIEEITGASSRESYLD